MTVGLLVPQGQGSDGREVLLVQVQSVKIEYDVSGRAVVMRVGAIGSELMEPLSFPFELPGPNAELAGMDEASFDQMLAELRTTAQRMCEMAVQSWLEPSAYAFGARGNGHR